MSKFFKSKQFQLCLGLFVSAALVYWVCKGIDWTKVSGEFERARYWILIPSLFLLMIQLLLRCLRWRHLLEGGRSIPMRNLFDSLMLGSFSTYILPFRAGEFVRPFILSQETDVSFGKGFVSVVIERFFDLSMVLLSFGIIAVYVPDLPPWVSRGAIGLSVIAVCILLFMLIGTFIPKPVLAFANLFLKPLPKGISAKLSKFLEDLLSGTAVLGRNGNIFWVIGYSFAVWADTYLLYWSFFFLFNLNVSIWVATTVTVFVALAVAAPSAPGFVGVYQAGCTSGFMLFGLNQETALAYAIFTHVVHFLIYVIFGVSALIRYDLSFADLKSASRASRE